MSDSFKAVLNEHLARELPFVAYRKPGDSILRVSMQQTSRIYNARPFNEPGFVFAPFDSSEDPLLLRPDETRRYSIPHSGSLAFPGAGQLAVGEADRLAYEGLVQLAIDQINEGKFRKIVVSRKLDVETMKSPVEILGVLLNLYPRAFCYLWYHPETGAWMGASPESLLHVTGESFFTMSLAGTIKSGNGEAPLWGKKEIMEQELVTRYIQGILEKRVAGFKTSAPRGIRAGDLWHLQSMISGKLGNSSVSELIEALHPTPAVCGIPRDDSLEFLKAHEGYDRRFYAGYLGELNMTDEASPDKGIQSHLFVNLRCMSFSGNSARIYVGGGITAKSLPGDEYRETTDKAATMARVLFYSEE